MEHARQRGLPGENLKRSRQKLRNPNILERRLFKRSLCQPSPPALVPARFGAVKTAAVVDKVAQVTIMISNMCENLGLKPGGYDKTNLVGNAKRDSTMWGVVWKHLAFQLGGRKHIWDIVEEAGISVVPILGSSAQEIPYGEKYKHPWEDKISGFIM